MARFSSIFPELDEIPGREFTPAEAATLSGVFPDHQRSWRSRGIVPASMCAPYSWEQVMQLAVMAELSSRGIALVDAWRVASSESAMKLHSYDFRNLGKDPHFLLCQQGSHGRFQVMSHAGRIEFNTADPWWGDFGFWVNYSEIQCRVVRAYENLGKKK